MKQISNKIAKISIIGLVTVAVCAGLLFLSSLIPRDFVRENCYESARYFAERKDFEYVRPGNFSSMQDNYADCILNNIIWQIDSENPIASSLEASYYSDEAESVNSSFLKSMEENLDANTEYVRYWHGSMVFLRPLFMVFNILQIRIALAVVVLLEVFAVCLLLVKSACGSGIKTAVCFVVALLLVHTYMIAASVEYVTSFLVMGAVLIALLIGLRKQTDYHAEGLFVISGVVTCFVDFLTTETITYTVPMAFLLVLIYENGMLRSVKEGIQLVIVNGFCWLMGYAGMFLAKWAFSFAAFGKTAVESAWSHAMVRIDGGVVADNVAYEFTKTQQLTGAIWQNLGCLFPIRNEMRASQVMIWTIAVLLLVAALFYLFRGKEMHGVLFMPLFLLAILPYARYLVLSNHACRHYFFTYRAQIITVFVILLFIAMDILPGIKKLVK